MNSKLEKYPEKPIIDTGYWLDLLIREEKKNNLLAINGLYLNNISCFIEVFNCILKVMNMVIDKKQFFEACLKKGLIEDIETWIIMKKDRDILAHYESKKEKEYYLSLNRIKKHIPVLVACYEKLLVNYYFGEIEKIKNIIKKHINEKRE